MIGRLAVLPSLLANIEATVFAAVEVSTAVTRDSVEFTTCVIWK